MVVVATESRSLRISATAPAVRQLGYVALMLLCAAPVAMANDLPVSPEPGRQFPELIRQIVREDPDSFRMKRGWKVRTEKAKANRESLAKGSSISSKSRPYGYKVAGTMNVPVLLARFSDSSAAPFARSEYEEMLFTGPWSTGTLNEYYDEISYGAFGISGQVADWVVVSQTASYYAGDAYGMGAGSKTGEFFTEVLDALDVAFDFSQFDNEGPDGVPNTADDDGYVDTICFVHELQGAESTGDETTFWSHHSTMTAKTGAPYQTNDLDENGQPIFIDDVLILPGVALSTDIIEIGIFAHEIGHSFGLKDFYDLYDAGTDGTCADDDSRGLGFWTLMASGNYNSKTSPAHMSAWSKAELGWLAPTVVSSDLLAEALVSTTLNPTAYKLWTNGEETDEYFLVEYRTADGFDQDLIAEGALIYHVNESVIDDGDGIAVNGNECLPLLDLECADQTGFDHTQDHDDLAAMLNYGDTGDVWTAGMSFSGSGMPSSISYEGFVSYVGVDLAAGAGGVLEADFYVENPTSGVDLCIRDCLGDDCSEPSACSVYWDSPDIIIDNDSDGIPDPPEEGEENRLVVTVGNIGTDDAENCFVSLYYSDPAIGGVLPVDAIPLASQQVPMIAAGSTVDVEFAVEIPGSPGGGVEQFCFVATVDYLNSFVGFDDGPDFNNVALINSQSFYDATTSKTSPESSLRAPYYSARTVKVMNRTGAPCDYEIVLGTPPSYNDEIIPSGWQYTVQPDSFSLAPNAMQVVTLEVSHSDPQHGDFIYLPITAICQSTGEVIGGDLMRWEVDNVPPDVPDALVAFLDLVDPPDEQPERDTVRLSWLDGGSDLAGQPEVVEHWLVYRGSSPTPGMGDSLLARVAMDRDSEAPGMQWFTDVPLDSADIWYRVVAVDRAGNRSGPATTALWTVPTGVTDRVPSVAPWLSLSVHPNPGRGSSNIQLGLRRPETIAFNVYDVAGRLVAKIGKARYEMGTHRVIWNHLDRRNKIVSPGVYFVQARGGGASVSQKILVMR